MHDHKTESLLFAQYRLDAVRLRQHIGGAAP